jgi:5'-hydroxyaverantin dehydrogenase
MVDIIKQNEPPSLDSTPPVPNHKAIDINLTGEWYSTYLSLHCMQLKPQSSGATNGVSTAEKKSIVMISSLTGYVDYPNNTAYAASKFGARGLWRSLRSKAPDWEFEPTWSRPHAPTVADMKLGLERAGVRWGKGSTWAPADNVVEAASYCAVGDDVDDKYPSAKYN